MSEIKLVKVFGQEGNPDYYVLEGVSLRDWYAGIAMQGLLAHPQSIEDCQVQAEWAYKYADAMLTEKEKRDGKKD